MGSRVPFFVFYSAVSAMLKVCFGDFELWNTQDFLETKQVCAATLDDAIRKALKRLEIIQRFPCRLNPPLKRHWPPPKRTAYTRTSDGMSSPHTSTPSLRFADYFWQVGLQPSADLAKKRVGVQNAAKDATTSSPVHTNDQNRHSNQHLQSEMDLGDEVLPQSQYNDDGSDVSGGFPHDEKSSPTHSNVEENPTASASLASNGKCMPTLMCVPTFPVT